MVLIIYLPTMDVLIEKTTVNSICFDKQIGLLYDTT